MSGGIRSPRRFARSGEVAMHPAHCSCCCAAAASASFLYSCLWPLHAMT